MENPSGWWKYAYNAICMDSREDQKHIYLKSLQGVGVYV